MFKLQADGYDLAGRMTGVNFSLENMTDMAIEYDAMGNPTKMTGPGTTLAYTYSGSPLTRKAEAGGDTWEYQWDARDKMTKVRKQPNGQQMADVATYSYDPQGRRYEKRTLGGMKLQRYYQDGLTPVVETVNVPSATIAHRSVLGALGNVIQTCNTSTGAETFYAYDRLGNVLATFDADGAKTAPVMDAFGNVLSGSPQAFGLTTKQYDGDVGLYYFEPRWYASDAAAFISVSPFGPTEPAYVFCDNTPLQHVDPTGLWLRDVHWDDTYLSCRCMHGCKGMCLEIADADQHYDENPDTAPTTFKGWWKGGHFPKDLGGPFGEAKSAIEGCDAFAFGAALHRVQDYWAHTYAGYGPWFGHWTHSTDWVALHEWQHDEAVKFTNNLLNQFLGKCGGKCNE
ncbi:MAG: hypothetical protein NTW86_14950 [Candidatus Sumerlaeota bacterium]|nr:hypothetical protein [Candidatus Sumerlaeota bacterium]